MHACMHAYMRMPTCMRMSYTHAGVCVGMCVGTHAGTRVGMRVGMHVSMCLGMRMLACV